MDERSLPITRRRRLRRRRSRRAHRKPLVALAVLAAIVLALVAGTAAVAKSEWDAFLASCSLDGLRPDVNLGQNSYVYAADGTFLGTIPSKVHRDPVPLARMSPWLEKATLAIEDRKFYAHSGVDFRGTVRAAVENLQAGRVVQGASTLTQQLVDNLYLTDEERNIAYKKREACLALKLDAAWSKKRILERYLNTVYYGHLAYGVEAAARTYFSKRAEDLGPAQAALLAGLPQQPSVFDPLRNPEAAKTRRNQVLRAMVATGALPAKAAAGLSELPLGLRPSRMYQVKRQPHFFEYVRKELVAAYGDRKVRRGGLRVTTTIDPRYQRLARRAIDSTLDRRGDPAAAIVTIDPRSGAIRAMQSRARGRQLEFNLSVQGRNEAGSTFKTFVLAAALQQGLDPYSTSYLSAPFTYETGNGDEVWKVHTYSNSYSGTMTVRQALLASDNTVFARLTLDVGPARVAQIARRLGITSNLLAVPSIGLGVNDVSVLEMTSAYATLAAMGTRREPYAIEKVVFPNGKADPRWGPSKPARAISVGVARTLDAILQENVLSGTGVAAQIGRPAAGKTGTTDEFTDAWFAGFTRNLATVVWIGHPKKNVPMRNIHGIRVAGGTFPAQIWGKYMRPATAKLKPRPFPPAGGVSYRSWDGSYAFSGSSSAASADDD